MNIIEGVSNLDEKVQQQDTKILTPDEHEKLLDDVWDQRGEGSGNEEGGDNIEEIKVITDPCIPRSKKEFENARKLLGHLHGTGYRCQTLKSLMEGAGLSLEETVKSLDYLYFAELVWEQDTSNTFYQLCIYEDNDHGPLSVTEVFSDRDIHDRDLPGRIRWLVPESEEYEQYQDLPWVDVGTTE